MAIIVHTMQNSAGIFLSLPHGLSEGCPCASYRACLQSNKAVLLYMLHMRLVCLLWNQTLNIHIFKPDCNVHFITNRINTRILFSIGVTPCNAYSSFPDIIVTVLDTSPAFITITTHSHIYMCSVIQFICVEKMMI